MTTHSTQRTICIAALAAAALALATPAWAIDSDGVYRLPYANGTTISIDSDGDPANHLDAADLNGTGGGPYRIVAASDGWVRRITDTNTGTGRTSGSPGGCRNNFVWIEHDNGEWTKYSHFVTGSVTNPTRQGGAGLSLNQRVSAGTFLGIEGDVGCAQGAHLHFEVARPQGGASGIRADGFLVNLPADRRTPRICNIPGGRLQASSSYTAESVPGPLPRGRSEVARHGLPISDYQCYFDQMAAAGYEPEWLDMSNNGARAFVNVIGQPASGQGSAFHGLSAAQYQSRFDSLTGNGYRPVIIESYLHNGQVRYAGFFKRTSGPAYAAYHGLSASAHQTRFEELSGQGYQPVRISVVSAGGQLRYTGLYLRRSGSFVLRSQIPVSEYQTVYNEQTAAGRRPVSLDGYVHNGQAMLAAVFAAGAGGQVFRHGLTSAQYQSNYSAQTSANRHTLFVTAYVDDGVKYAAGWGQ